MNRGQGLRPCGKRWATEEAAKHSKRGLTEGAVVIPCALGCGGFHVAVPKAPDLRAREARSSSGTKGRKSPRNTGPDELTRAVIYNRDGNRCAACGKSVPAGSWRSIQHRVARAHGGTNDTFNLVLLCGSATSAGCHRVCEDRKKHMQAQGFYLESWQDPRAEPIMLHGQDGGVTVWLTDDGEYALENPLAVTA